MSCSYLAPLLAVVGLLCSLPSLRAWLHLRRLRASAQRSFRYRRIMSPAQRARRDRILADLVRRQRPVAYIPDIGAVFRERVGPSRTYSAAVVDPPFSAARFRPCGTIEWSMWHEQFEQIPVRTDSRSRVHAEGIMIEIDQEDATGRRYLLSLADWELTREMYKKWGPLVG